MLKNTMTPIYKTERATVYCGKAEDILPTLDSESADLVIADPPYGAGWQSNRRATPFDRIDNDGAGEGVGLVAAVTPNLVRVTRRRRHLYTFGLPVQHELLPVKADLIWDKGRVGSGDLTCAWGPSHEPIFFHVKAPDKANARQASGALSARLRQGSVLRVRRLSATQVKRHPTEKPVALMRQLIESSSQPDELVLDPFAGVGSTGVAAILSGRRALLVELNPKYAEVAAQRIAAAEALMDKAVSL